MQNLGEDHMALEVSFALHLRLGVRKVILIKKFVWVPTYIFVFRLFAKYASNGNLEITKVVGSFPTATGINWFKCTLADSHDGLDVESQHALHTVRAGLNSARLTLTDFRPRDERDSAAGS